MCMSWDRIRGGYAWGGTELGAGYAWGGIE